MTVSHQATMTAGPRRRITYLKDGESRLRVSLPPLPLDRVIGLQGIQSRASHRQVGDIKHVSSLTVHVDIPITEAKDLECGEVAAQVHSNKLSTAFLIT